MCLRNWANVICLSQSFRMNELGLLPAENKVFFGQLLGMCDQISFPLGEENTESTLPTLLHSHTGTRQQSFLPYVTMIWEFQSSLCRMCIICPPPCSSQLRPMRPSSYSQEPYGLHRQTFHMSKPASSLQGDIWTETTQYWPPVLTKYHCCSHHFICQSKTDTLVKDSCLSTWGSGWNELLWI